MKKTSVVAALLAALMLAGCAGFGMPDEADAELVAAAALEYQSVRQVELADGGEAALLSDTSAEAARALAEDSLVGSRALGDPTPLVESIDAGHVRVTATWTDDDGLAVVSIIERQRRPAASFYDGTNATVTTTGTETRTIEGVTVRDCAVSVEWKWDGATYYKYRLTRSGETLRNLPQVGVSTIVEWDAAGDLVSRTVTWLKLDETGTPAIRSITYTPLLDDQGLPVLNPEGNPELKMALSDREGWAVLVDKSPRTVEYYRADGTLKLRVIHDPTPGIPGVEISREYFDADGTTSLRKVTGTMRLAMTDGSLTLVREVGDRKVSIEVAETEAGLSVEYDGETWTIVQNDDGSLDLSGPDGSSFHVTYGPDGTPIVTEA